jgi:hypothetical protein
MLENNNRYYVYSKTLKKFATGNGWSDDVGDLPEVLTIDFLPTPYFLLQSHTDPKHAQEWADALNIASANFNHAEAMKPENQKFIVIEVGKTVQVWTPPAFRSKTFYARNWSGEEVSQRDAAVESALANMVKEVKDKPANPNVCTIFTSQQKTTASIEAKVPKGNSTLRKLKFDSRLMRYV